MQNLPAATAALICAALLAGGARADTGSPGTTAGEVVVKVEQAVERGVKAAASGVERGARAAASGVERGVKAAAGGVARGAKATARVADRVAGSTGASSGGK